jgi:hypothetical protein
MCDPPCPVCGFGLDEPAWGWAGASFQICSCCGTQFGYHDAGGGAEERRRAHLALRDRWVAAGMPWYSNATPPPPGWSARKQLQRVV